jgi:hypothetical protein
MTQLAADHTAAVSAEANAARRARRALGQGGEELDDAALEPRVHAALLGAGIVVHDDVRLHAHASRSHRVGLACSRPRSAARFGRGRLAHAWRIRGGRGHGGRGGGSGTVVVGTISRARCGPKARSSA